MPYWTLLPNGILTVIFLLSAITIQVVFTKFSCNGRTSGYYADVESGCQVYHMCDGIGRQFTYTCPNATLFQQRMLICDHWYMVNCSKSESDYSANLRIGQREKPFVDDSDSHPYHRTPRPDLLSHPSDSEINIIYRRSGRGRFGDNQNVVGAETDAEDSSATSSSTDGESLYFLPSHWSTQYSSGDSSTTTTNKPPNSNFNNNRDKSPNFNAKKTITNNTRIKGKPVNPALVEQVPQVNYKSSFKATTPVYPQNVDATSLSPDSLGILPPIPYRGFANKSSPPEQINQLAEAPREDFSTVNFISNFKATTPVYPKSVESTSAEPGELGVLPPKGFDNNPPESGLSNEEIPGVNFQSHFKATTPVYPQSVEATSAEPGELGVLPPKGVDNSEKEDAVVVNFQSKFKATTPVYPLAVEATSPEPGDFGVLPPKNINNNNPEQLLQINNKDDVATVNFRSEFKATTPVYPQSVEATSQEPGDLGVLPPLDSNNKIDSNGDQKVSDLSLDFVPPAFDANFEPRNRSELLSEVQRPSKFYQPPKFEPDYQELAKNAEEIKNKRNGLKSRNNAEWENLRKKFLIPDYEFPLESVSRPSYDSVLSSFQNAPPGDSRKK